MSIRKTRKRYTGVADLEERSIWLFHLNREEFSGISFEDNVQMRGKLRLDQNDGTPIPDAQLPEIIHGVDISKQIDNIINEPKDIERKTMSLSYDELTRWKFRKGQHVTLYLNYEAKLDAGSNGSVRITIGEKENSVQHEETGVTSSWVEYTATKNISSLDDGWCEIILEAKVPLGAETIFVRTFTISIRRT